MCMRFTAGGCSPLRDLAGKIRKGGADFTLLHMVSFETSDVPEVSVQELLLIYTHLALNLCWLKHLLKTVANQKNFVVVLSQVIV